MGARDALVCNALEHWVLSCCLQKCGALSCAQKCGALCCLQKCGALSRGACGPCDWGVGMVGALAGAKIKKQGRALLFAVSSWGKA